MRILSISGGKGGIGKTTISVNLAVAFAKLKKKVLLFDADLGLANVDVLLGLSAKRNISDVISGACQLNEVCLQGPHGLKIIPGSSGVQKLSELQEQEAVELVQAFSGLTDDVDVMLVDLASGISNQVLTLTHASQDILIVLCNDPSSFADSYAMIKLLHQKYARSRFGIVVNKVKDTQEGYQVFSQFQGVVSQFLNVSIQYLGNIFADDYVQMAARERSAVVDKYPASPAAKQFMQLCHGIQQWGNESQPVGGIQYFFERLIHPNLACKELM